MLVRKGRKSEVCLCVCAANEQEEGSTRKHDGMWCSGRRVGASGTDDEEAIAESCLMERQGVCTVGWVGEDFCLPRFWGKFVHCPIDSDLITQNTEKIPVAKKAFFSLLHLKCCLMNLKLYDKPLIRVQTSSRYLSLS